MAETPEQQPLFITTHRSHDGIQLGESYDYSPIPNGSEATNDTGESAEDIFEERNDQLMRVVQTGGLLSLLNRRIQATRMYKAGWTSERLRQYTDNKRQSADGKDTIENATELAGRYSEALIAACGNCALSEECTLANSPDKFRQRFKQAQTRQKLVRRIARDPSTKCDEVA
jgi:hypothetical protein